MQVTHENLIIVTRPAEDDIAKEVLIGRKLRGPLHGVDVFPGGKLESDEGGRYGASRELREATGLQVRPRQWQAFGKIIVSDARPHSSRFGRIELFHAQIGRDQTARITDELEPRWVDLRDRYFTGKMHPDVQLWWPYVFAPSEPFRVRPLVAHIIFHHHGALEIIAKEPARPGFEGAIYEEKIIEAHDLPERFLPGNIPPG